MFNRTTLRKFIAPRRQARKERHLLIFRTLAPPFDVAQDMLCVFARDIVFPISFSIQNFKGKCLMRLARRTIKKARIEIIPMIDTIFFLLGLFHDLDFIDGPLQRPTGQPAEGGHGTTARQRKCRGHDHCGR